MKSIFKAVGLLALIMNTSLLVNAQGSFILNRKDTVQNANFWINGYAGIGPTTSTTRLTVSDTSTVIYRPNGTGAGIPPGSIAQIYNQSGVDGSGAHLLFTAFNSGGFKNIAYIGAVSNPGSSWAPELVMGQRTDGNAWAERLRIAASGNVGIGVTNPVRKLDVDGGVQTTGALGGFKFNSRKLDGNDYQWYSDDGSARLYDHNNAIDRIVITDNGNVGIGTAATGTNKLAVEGTIGARRVKVDQLAWADFVFEPDYKLPSLVEVEAYIKEHKHLPDVPSAKDVANEKLDLGEMNKILLQKIEELTLHLIEQEKHGKEQDLEITRLKEQMLQMGSKQ